jgi:hypothetical protein
MQKVMNAVSILFMKEVGSKGVGGRADCCQRAGGGAVQAALTVAGALLLERAVAVEVERAVASEVPHPGERSRRHEGVRHGGTEAAAADLQWSVHSVEGGGVAAVRCCGSCRFRLETLAALEERQDLFEGPAGVAVAARPLVVVLRLPPYVQQSVD